MAYSHTETSESEYIPFEFKVVTEKYSQPRIHLWLPVSDKGLVRAELSLEVAIKLAGHLLQAAPQDSDTEALGKQIVAGIEKTDGGSVEGDRTN